LAGYDGDGDALAGGGAGGASPARNDKSRTWRSAVRRIRDQRSQERLLAGSGSALASCGGSDTVAEPPNLARFRRHLSSTRH
jgi:hypothetical protein